MPYATVLIISILRQTCHIMCDTAAILSDVPLHHSLVWMHIDWLVNLRIAYDTPQPMDVYVEGRCSVFHSERKPGQGSQSDLRSSDAYGSEHMNTDIKLQVPCADGTYDMWRSHISEGSVLIFIRICLYLVRLLEYSDVLHCRKLAQFQCRVEWTTEL